MSGPAKIPPLPCTPNSRSLNRPAVQNTKGPEHLGGEVFRPSRCQGPVLDRKQPSEERAIPAQRQAQLFG
jgi:hypothetical protein